MNIGSKLKSLFCRGKIKLIDNTDRIQIQQNELLAGQIRSNIYAPQQYGIETAPHVGADTVCLFKGGDVENGYVIKSFDTRYKPTDIEEGDTFVYTSRNVSSESKATGTIEFTSLIDNTIVPVGTRLIDPLDEDREYTTIEAGQILGGKAWVRTEAAIGGVVGNKPQGTILTWHDDQDPIPNIESTTVNNISVTHQKIWIKEVEGRILIETTDADVQIIANNAEVNTIGDATVTAGNDANVRAVNNVDVKSNTATITATTSATVACPLTTWAGNIVLTGNITQTGTYTLVGDIAQTGSITSSGDHKAGTISLMTHVHPGDGGTGSGADTGAPIA